MERNHASVFLGETVVKVLAEETWAWMLYGDGARYFVSIVCGTVAVYTIDLELTVDEVAAFHREGAPFISRLALIVSSRPNEYRARHIARFDSVPGISDATKAWRRAHPV